MPDADPSSTDHDAQALAMVHAGWDHLQRQRPLAAWASWRQALRLVPEFPAAARALDTLASAGDLPESARADYRFFAPTAPDQRARWDAALRGRDLADLDAAAGAFGALADGGDARAAFNQALCLAWRGENAGAVAALDRAADHAAATEPDVAVTAAALAEVVRQGAGAEADADDLNRIALITWADPNDGPDPAAFLDGRTDVRPIPHPVDPATGRPSHPELGLFDWLDHGPGPVRRLLATAIRSRAALRLSGTDPNLLERAVAEVIRAAGHRVARVERQATPLPLAFLDAAVWSVRLDPGLEPDAVDRLNRQIVEQYYETQWINQPRQGLDGLTPLAAAARAKAGDAALLAKLLGVVRVREQLGARPSAVRLYQGYPFDRLRRRLGLETVDPDAVDPAEPATMAPADLDALDPAALDGLALAEAFASALALGDDARTARFAAALAAADPVDAARHLAAAGAEPSAAFATLVRVALADDDVPGALAAVDRALAADAATGGAQAAAYTTWRAEILARAGQPDAALAVYRQLLDANPTALVALDAAETMLDNGHDDHARTLTRLARDLAQEADDHALADRAEALL